jgi:phosphate transport system substrate-binding protein
MEKRNALLTVLCFTLVLLLPSSGFSKDQPKQVITIYGSTTCISRFLEPGARDLEKMKNIRIRTVGVGTGQGLFALMQGRTEVSAASEDLQAAIESAKKYAEQKGMPLRVYSGLQFHKIADDEVVVIVHKDNPVSSLTWKQLKAINTGTIKNWKEVGGPDLPVKVVTSHEGGATRLFFLKLVMENAPYAADATTVWTTEKEIQEVVRDRGGIGAVSITFHARAPESTKIIATQRIVRPLGLITSGKPSPKVQKVIDFFTSGDGRKYTQYPTTIHEDRRVEPSPKPRDSTSSKKEIGKRHEK